MGIEKQFDEDGDMIAETPYSNGIVHGRQNLYYKSGALMSVTDYRNGSPVLRKDYAQNGALQTVSDYENGHLSRTRYIQENKTRYFNLYTEMKRRRFIPDQKAYAESRLKMRSLLQI